VSWLLAAAQLERQVYDRLVEDRPVEPSYLDGIATGQPAWSGLNCSIFLADIAAFGRHSRNDKDRQLLRALMYGTLQHAFESSGVPWHSCYREDRGDGVLVIVPPSTPTRLLIDPLSDDIAMALALHNGQATEALRMQLRVALHVGPVISDPEGVNGESIILAARILEAPVLKRQLAIEAADLGLIVSAYVYDTVVKHGPGRIDPARYRQVRVQLKESRLNAWICLSGLGCLMPFWHTLRSDRVVPAFPRGDLVDGVPDTGIRPVAGMALGRGRVLSVDVIAFRRVKQAAIHQVAAR
jgi:class 3 adenylate cyclase